MNSTDSSLECVSPKAKSKRPVISEVLPNDQKLANRYVVWKNLIDKYSKVDGNDEELDIDEAIERYVGKKRDEEESSEEEPENNVIEVDECSSSDSSTDYDDVREELAEAKKKRISRWKENGMEKVFTTDFTVNVEAVMQWFDNCQLGEGKTLSQERETHFTEMTDNSQMNVTCKTNISLLNDDWRKQISTANTTNYEFAEKADRKIIVRQVEKRTISSFIPSMPHTPYNAVQHRPDFDLMFDSNFLSHSMPGFGLPKPLTQFKHIELGQPLLSAMKKSTVVPKDAPQSSRKESAQDVGFESHGKNIFELKKNNNSKVCKQVRFKPSKKKPLKRLPSESSSTDSDDDNVPIINLITSCANRSNHSCATLRDQYTKNKSNSSKSNTILAKNKTLNPNKLNEKSTQSKMNQPLKSSSNETNGVLSKDLAKLILTDICKPTANQVSTHSMNNKSTLNNHSCVAKDRDVSIQKAYNNRNYPMPADYRHQLSINGRLPYKTQGTVVYRPKSIHQSLPRNAAKICINSNDLDLNAVTCPSRRKKFENFNRLIHPNSTLVYYMSESDEEPESKEKALSVKSNAQDEMSEDDDDPILTFRPQLCILTFFNDDANVC
ncbi:uncharacterized protein LOC128727717 [Anopheles nili]|uniref:uncharacterized protein LOC128727717 n=1 Tax=Anopheles nili TaxID=185578 RepID=UPI00237AF028|nr:uncharacterized protein LOC128727717 [Anopheles nili]